MSIEVLKHCIELSKFRITNHGLEEMENDNILSEDIKIAVKTGEIIEDYPHDFPLPSCLVFGYDKQNEAIHMVWAYNREKEMAILITTYKPNPLKWIEFKKRVQQ